MELYVHKSSYLRFPANGEVNQWHGYRKQGLIALEHKSHAENAVLLCPNCHGEFDDIQYPGFIFFPADLQYFIDFEKDNYRRREVMAQNGETVPTRSCPFAEDYLISQNCIPVDRLQKQIGGLYQRYFLSDYLSRLGRDPTFSLGRLPAKQWHGSLTAILIFTFQVYSLPRAALRIIPQDQQDMLRELQTLYMRAGRVRTGPLAVGTNENMAHTVATPGEAELMHQTSSNNPDASSTNPFGPAGKHHTSVGNRNAASNANISSVNTKRKRENKQTVDDRDDDSAIDMLTSSSQPIPQTRPFAAQTSPICARRRRIRQLCDHRRTNLTTKPL